MPRVIRARLEGPDAEFGKVAARDVARLILNLETALARAAYVTLGRSRPGQTGRHATAIEKASRLRFLGVRKGSLIELLALPDGGEASEDEFPVDVEHLGERAWDELLESIRSGGDETDAELAAAVATLGDELGIGQRNRRLHLGDADLANPRHTPRNNVVINAEVRTRMRRIATAPRPAQDDTVVGKLVEADFEHNSARLRSPSGQLVTVSFPEELADEIHTALRKPASQLVGRVTYDPKSATARSIDLARVTRADQLALDGAAFYDERSVAEHTAEPAVVWPVDLSELGDPDLTEEERAAFLSAFADA
jgi:hypothetical protein